MMDAVDKYNPDFIYTDGTDQQPFSSSGTGTGYKCDAMQRVIADFYNKTLDRRGKFIPPIFVLQLAKMGPSMLGV